METQLPQERGTTSPLNFRLMTIVAKRLRAAFVREVGLVPGDIVLHGDPALRLPRPVKGAQPQFLVHVNCGQTAGWIKMPLDKEISHGPVDIVLDGDPSLFPKKRHNPQFSVHVYCGQTVAHLSYC